MGRGGKDSTPRKGRIREEEDGEGRWVKIKIKRLEKRITSRKEEIRGGGRGRGKKESGKDVQKEGRQSTLDEFLKTHHRLQGGREKKKE